MLGKKMDVNDTLAVTDYAVIAIMLAISSGIGIYYRFTGGRQKTTEVRNNICLP